MNAEIHHGAQRHATSATHRGHRFGRFAPYLPWTHGTGRAIGSWRRIPLAIACCAVYLILSWALFLTLLDDDREGRIDRERVEDYIYRIPDLSRDFPHALRSLLTAPFLNHDTVQIVYVTILLLLFGLIFEAREGARTTVLVFFGTNFAAAVGGGILLHLLYPEVSTAPSLARAWDRTWSGGSAGCFGLMGALAARARRPWALFGLFLFWEVNVWYWYLRGYTSVFHLVALIAGYLVVRRAIRPRSP